MWKISRLLDHVTKSWYTVERFKLFCARTSWRNVALESSGVTLQNMFGLSPKLRASFCGSISCLRILLVCIQHHLMAARTSTLQSASISFSHFSHFSHFRVPRKALSLKTQTFDQYHSCWGWRVINKVRQSRGLQINTTCLAPSDTLWLIFQIQNHNKYRINRINV